MASTTAVNRPDNAEPAAKPKWYRQLYFWVIVAIVAGVLVGWLAPASARRWNRSARRSSPRCGC